MDATESTTATFRYLADKGKDGKATASKSGDARMVVDGASAARHGDDKDGRIFVAVPIPDSMGGGFANVPLARNVYLPGKAAGAVNGLTFEIRVKTVETGQPVQAVADTASLMVAAIAAKDLKMLTAAYLTLPGMTPQRAKANAKAALSA